MLLKLSSDHLEHLEFLKKIDVDVAIEFANISLQFLQNGINKKMFKAASQKLNVEISVVENSIFGLMQLFLEASKMKLNDLDFYDSLMVHSFSSELATMIKDLYLQNVKSLSSNLKVNMPQLPRYKNLEWRLDIKLASRSLYNQLSPAILLKLAVENHVGTETKLLQTDLSTLHHMIAEIEDALNQSKSKHVQRFIRNLS